MKLLRLSFLVAGLALISSCKDDDPDAINKPTISEDIRELLVPSSFNFETSTEIQMQVQVDNLQDLPLAGVKVSFYNDHPDFGGEEIAVGFTNTAGALNMLVLVPAFQDSMVVRVHQTGFSNMDTVAVRPNVSLSFGGANAPRKNKNKAQIASPIPISGNFYYKGSFVTGTYKGLPNYLENPGDVLSQQFLDDVDASLPEEAPVPTNNPQYLTTGNELDVVITDLSDVWITFVAEGAGYRNALGYYVFDSNNPPNSPSDIDSIFVLFPNTSFAGSGGQLNSGDKINLGTYSPGKTISWVLFQNAWTGSGVNVNRSKFYSNSDFNTTESDPTKKQHTVALVDISRQIVLCGFEDQNRSAGSDNDFNDLIFYVSANPWEAIEIGAIPPVTPTQDSDGDGIADESDDFPNDPARAVLNNYSGSIAYEDLWPAQGDYDFNDLVLDYNVNHVLNASNEILDIEATWTIKAVGAGFANGFGFEFDNLQPSDIAAVSGYDLQENIISLNANGTESGQTTATIIAFDNVFNLISSSGGAFINTVKGQSYSQPVSLTTSIVFNTPQAQSNIGLPPYDPFMIVNGQRGREIHLSGESPTALADQSLFNTLSDASDVNANYYYRTSNGMPWGINVSTTFQYPAETEPIDDAYLNFSDWASSGGASKIDWFQDVQGYREPTKIF